MQWRWESARVEGEAVRQRPKGVGSVGGHSWPSDPILLNVPARGAWVIVGNKGIDGKAPQGVEPAA